MSGEPPTPGAFSKLIVYVDESGDHGPVSAEFPVFVLAFCIFDKHEYANTVTSYMHRLKFKHFGHDAVVMHERDIRKSTGPFTLLINPVARNTFLSDISVLIEKSPLVLIAAVIDKAKLAAQHAEPPNPYHLALKFGLERIHRHRAGLQDEGSCTWYSKAVASARMRSWSSSFGACVTQTRRASASSLRRCSLRRKRTTVGCSSRTWWRGRSGGTS